MKKYLGIDWGEKRIGLALADSENNIATPFKTVFNVSELIEIIDKEEINSLVLGQPRKMLSWKVENPSFDKFVEILKSKLKNKKVDIFFVDERLSSLQADSFDFSGLKSDRDSVSAMIILQSYLDKNYVEN
jgi:putative holliday junction resolvase